MSSWVLFDTKVAERGTPTCSITVKDGADASGLAGNVVCHTFVFQAGIAEVFK